MRRREFIAFVGGTLASSAAKAQRSTNILRVGVMTGYAENDPEARSRISAFHEGLKGLGWQEGRNLLIDYRWPAGDTKRTRQYAAELMRLAPDVILCGGTPVTAVMQQATSKIPLVFVQVIDPVVSKFVASLSKPGGNITGFTNYEHGMGGKWLELLREAAPGLRRTLVILNPNSAGSTGILRLLENAAQSLGVEVTSVAVHGPTEIERAFDEFSPQPNGGVLVIPDALVSVHRQIILSRAEKYGIPAIYPFRFFAEEGGLMSYGVDAPDLFRRAAGYVDRILKGESPANLPVQAPTKFDFVVNLRTAKSLGLNLSPSLLARADEVIE